MDAKETLPDSIEADRQCALTVNGRGVSVRWRS